VCTIAEDYTYMKYYAQYALAIKDRAVKLGNLDASFFVPFCIMVSDDTHDRTVKLLEDNDYYGLNKD